MTSDSWLLSFEKATNHQMMTKTNMILCDRWAKITYLTEYDPAFVNIIGTICLFSVAVRKENIEFAISHLVNSYLINLLNKSSYNIY